MWASAPTGGASRGRRADGPGPDGEIGRLIAGATDWRAGRPGPYGEMAPREAFPLGGRCPSAHTGADEGRLEYAAPYKYDRAGRLGSGLPCDRLFCWLADTPLGQNCGQRVPELDEQDREHCQAVVVQPTGQRVRQCRHCRRHGTRVHVHHRCHPMRQGGKAYRGVGGRSDAPHPSPVRALVTPSPQGGRLGRAEDRTPLIRHQCAHW